MFGRTRFDGELRLLVRFQKKERRRWSERKAMAAPDGPMPSLQLEDIIHALSPEPTVQHQHDLRQETASPEPLTEADIMRIRRRVDEMGLETKLQHNVSSREKELLDMVRYSQFAMFQG